MRYLSCVLSIGSFNFNIAGSSDCPFLNDAVHVRSHTRRKVCTCTNLRAGVRFEMQMSVSRCYKPPECGRHPARSETTTLSPFPFSIRRRKRGRGKGIQGGDRRRISGLNYQTGYPQRKPSEAVPSSPNAPETRIEMVRIEIGRSESGYSRALSTFNRACRLALIASATCTSPVSLGTYICKLFVQINNHIYAKYYRFHDISYIRYPRF